MLDFHSCFLSHIQFTDQLSTLPMYFLFFKNLPFNTINTFSISYTQLPSTLFIFLIPFSFFTFLLSSNILISSPTNVLNCVNYSIKIHIRDTNYLICTKNINYTNSVRFNDWLVEVFSISGIKKRCRSNKEMLSKIKHTKCHMCIFSEHNASSTFKRLIKKFEKTGLIISFKFPRWGFTNTWESTQYSGKEWLEERGK